ncbi:4-hydroxy-3-methylbut-2-enyl diphosphate reductase [Alphaproteobacteria bacterium]|nr:4-hydroxy-3-methylbut-2-enyl diphosphate reductase [Alphaproteobacteria bacterium]
MKVLLASPRGFCAGVKRAIDMVDLALQNSKSPIYVRHEIVHNKRVVNDLKKKGAIFVKQLEEVPKGAKVIFSAHGVSKKVKKDAKKYKQLSIDATCPLVSKVHQQIKLYDKKGYKILLIGHKGHPEVDGIEGQVSQKILVIENEEQAAKLIISNTKKIAYVTQTTLSLNDTSEIIKILKNKFPNIIGPNLDDICYATQNRQIAVAELADSCDLVFVVGGENSSNTKRLAEIVKKKNISVFRISGKDDIDKSWLEGVKTLGITSGASSPEVLINEILEFLKNIYFEVEIDNLKGIEENITFKPLTKFS